MLHCSLLNSTVASSFSTHYTVTNVSVFRFNVGKVAKCHHLKNDDVSNWNPTNPRESKLQRPGTKGTMMEDGRCQTLQPDKRKNELESCLKSIIPLTTIIKEHPTLPKETCKSRPGLPAKLGTQMFKQCGHRQRKASKCAS